MAYPPAAHDELILEAEGTTTGPDDVSAYNWVSDWIPVGDIQSISVAVYAPNAPDRASVEEGMYRASTTEPAPVAWTLLPPVVDNLAPGGAHYRSTVGRVDLTARYFRVHVLGFTGPSGVFVSVRATRRGVR